MLEYIQISTEAQEQVKGDDADARMIISLLLLLFGALFLKTQNTMECVALKIHIFRYLSRITLHFTLSVHFTIQAPLMLF